MEHPLRLNSLFNNGNWYYLINCYNIKAFIFYYNFLVSLYFVFSILLKVFSIRIIFSIFFKFLFSVFFPKTCCQNKRKSQLLYIDSKMSIISCCYHSTRPTHSTHDHTHTHTLFFIPVFFWHSICIVFSNLKLCQSFLAVANNAPTSMDIGLCSIVTEHFFFFLYIFFVSLYLLFYFVTLRVF